MLQTHEGLRVHAHTPEGHVLAVLSSSHAASSYGQPVLLLTGRDAGPSYHAEAVVPFGPLDLTPWGPAVTLTLAPEPGATPEEVRILTSWERLRRLARYAPVGEAPPWPSS